MAVPSDGMNARLIPAAAISEAGSTSAAKLPSGRTRDSTAMPAASSSRPATIGVLNAEAGDDAWSDDDHPEHDRGGHRQQRRAALEGAEAEHLLQVEVQEEPHRDPRRAEQHLRDVGGGQVRRAEDARAASAARAGRPGRPRTAASSDEAAGELTSGRRRAPALLGSADDAEHGQREAAGGRERRRARSIEPRRAGAAGIRPRRDAPARAARSGC